MPRFSQVTGIILAGGLGRRLGGTNKAFLDLNGVSFIERLIELFDSLFGQSMIVANNPAAFADLPIRVVQDLEPYKGTIMGLITGLDYAATDWSFVTACDTPLLQEEVVSRVVEATGPEVKVVLSQTPDGLQPLVSAYHRGCLPALTKLYKQGERSLRPLFKMVPVTCLEVADMLEADPELLSFININTPQDLNRLK